jgi:hypothetical protein
LRKATARLGVQINSRLAGGRRESLLQDPTFLAQVVNATGHALVDGVGHDW